MIASPRAQVTLGTLCLMLLGAGGVAQDGPSEGGSSADGLHPDVSAVVDGEVTPSKVTALPDGPANFRFDAEGRIWAAGVYDGKVTRYDPATGFYDTVYQVEVIQTMDERGLAGLALAHDHAQTGAFYLYYTAPEGDQGINRLVRVEDGKEQLLTTVPAAYEHNGGRIVVAPDGTLFVSTGDNQLRHPAQDPSSHLGKILHMTPQGRPVEGNIEGLVYSLGHRNVYGLAYNEDTKELWATENSGPRDDEINRIVAGGNYGFPECEADHVGTGTTPCPTDKGYTFPVMSFYDDHAVAPTGATFWHGDLWWGSFNEGGIHRLWYDNETASYQDTLVHEATGCGDSACLVLDVQVGPDGDLYYSTFDAIWQFDTDPSSGPAFDPLLAIPIVFAGALAVVGSASAYGFIRRRRTRNRP